MFEKFYNWALADKRVFAENLGFYKLFWFFMIGSIFGVYYEQILNLVKCYLNYGNIVWEYRRGVIYEPLNPLYGMGCILFIYFLTKKNYSILKTFIYGSLIGGILEYFINFIQEKVTHQVSWDYFNLFLNINGRTTIPIMLVWGILALFVVKIVYPFVSNLIEKIPYNLGVLLTKIFFVIVLLDCLISWGAIIRQGFRIKGFKQYTLLDKFFDKYYSDAFLHKHFPNMRLPQ